MNQEGKIERKSLLRSILTNVRNALVSEDSTNLENLYKEFIRNYNNSINKTLNFTNPIQVSQAYNFAYRNGYLSKDSKFTYTTNRDEIIYYLYLLGATVVTGKGCCRHTASLLSDIYKDYGFTSTPISTGINQRIKTINFEKLSKSQIKFIQSLNPSKMTEDEVLTILRKKGIPIIEKEWEYDRKKVPSNHFITGVSYDDKSYYIDPTNKTYYQLDNETGRLINSAGNIENTITYVSAPFIDKKLIKTLISLPSTDFETINSICNSTDLLCRNNSDLFKQFCRENQELYGEITEELKKTNI